MNFFNKESEDLLNNEETSSWKKEEIKNSRIKYFQNQGLNLGFDYDSYLNYHEIDKYYPNPKLISTVTKVKQELKKRLAKKQFELTPVYKEYFDYLQSFNIKTIDYFSEDLLFYTEELGYKLFDVIAIGTYVSPVITSKNKLHSLLYFDLNTTKSYQDQFFLHELNHIIESNLLSVNDNNYVVKTGFDYLTIDLKEQEDGDEERREFEYLNEVINELFSQEIHEKMNDAGIYIFNSKDDTKIQGGTAYETVRNLIINFYNYYKEDIKEARLNFDMTNFFNKVGKDNLIALNNLVVTFFDNFGGFAYYSLIQELRNGEETERTILYKKLLQESKDILNRMKNYQELNYFGKK